ncbi:hypothetical protein DINM_005687 [Dirofilaria immitis]|nr:hypothetical protein [Dirofilaria immitis]
MSPVLGIEAHRETETFITDCMVIIIILMMITRGLYLPRSESGIIFNHAAVPAQVTYVFVGDVIVLARIMIARSGFVRSRRFFRRYWRKRRGLPVPSRDVAHGTACFDLHIKTHSNQTHKMSSRAKCWTATNMELLAKKHALQQEENITNATSIQFPSTIFNSNGKTTKRNAHRKSERIGQYIRNEEPNKIQQIKSYTTPDRSEITELITL